MILVLTAKYIIHLHLHNARLEEGENTNDERTITADESTDDEHYYGDSESEKDDSSYQMPLGRRQTISLHDRLKIHELMNQFNHEQEIFEWLKPLYPAYHAVQQLVKYQDRPMLLRFLDWLEKQDLEPLSTAQKRELMMMKMKDEGVWSRISQAITLEKQDVEAKTFSNKDSMAL